MACRFCRRRGGRFYLLIFNLIWLLSGVILGGHIGLLV